MLFRSTINGPSGFSEYVYLAPMTFTAFDGTSATGDAYNFTGFCVDIFHNIGLGSLNLTYNDNTGLTTDSHFPSATALSAAQLLQVGQLVNYGSLVAGGPSSADTVARLAGLQGAIWQVINPGYSVTSGSGLVNGYISAYSGASYNYSLTGYGPVGSAITFISETGKYGTGAAHQSFAFAAAVPEPATWAMMITGIGLTGALVRRSRRTLAAARAA